MAHVDMQHHLKGCGVTLLDANEHCGIERAEVNMALYSVSHERVSPMTPDTCSHKEGSRKVISSGGLGMLSETRNKRGAMYIFGHETRRLQHGV